AHPKIKLHQQFSSLKNWPSWAHPKKNPNHFALNPAINILSRSPDSFQFDSSGLPVAPDYGVTLVGRSVSVAQESLSAVVLAPEREILRAYDRKELVFTANSDGQTIRGVLAPGLSLDQARKKVDRIVFFKPNDAESSCLLVLPVIKGTLSKLKIADEGARQAKLEVDGKFRLFAPAGGAESLDFEIDINHNANRQVQFHRFETHIANFPDFKMEDLQNQSGTRSRDGGFPMPDIGKKIGLAGGTIDLTYKLRQKLDFILNEPGESLDEFPALLMRITTEVGLTGPTGINQGLIPFAIAFSPEDMPHVKNHTNNTWPISILLQRQAHGEKWKDVNEAGVHWIFEAVFPHKAALDVWNDLVTAPVSQSLRTVQDGRPVTFLPTFSNRETGVALWKAKFSVIDGRKRPDIDEDKIR